MPILNYTTEVPTDRTVAEIQRTLARAGAVSVRVDGRTLFEVVAADPHLPLGHGETNE